jgi:hypothetical protein
VGAVVLRVRERQRGGKVLPRRQRAPKGPDPIFRGWIFSNPPKDPQALTAARAQVDACASSNTGILNASLNHPENTTGWTCVAFKTLGYSKKPYTNPNKRTCTVPGEPQLRDKNPPSPLPRTNRTSLVPPPVLIGHAASQASRSSATRTRARTCSARARAAPRSRRCRLCPGPAAAPPRAPPRAPPPRARAYREGRGVSD